MIAQLRTEGLVAAGHLRGGVLDEALRGLQATFAQPIAITAASLCASLVVVTTQSIPDLGLEAFLDD